ncbi:MAG: endo-1,4-beta-xylanase [Myxococcales bacterium]|nr:endo-1,4-beta-xylanase [Myxococcales bacterium]
MKNPSLLPFLLLAVGCGLPIEAEPPTATAQAALVVTRLRELASPNVPIVGAAVRFNPLVNEPSYATTLAQNYNQVSVENALKWHTVRPSPTEFRFEQADTVIAAAEQAGQSVCVHSLVWEVNLPAWFTALSGSSLRNAMLDHITTVVSRYQGRIAHWVVVNEPLTAGGTFRNNVFFQAMGSSYIADAFNAAHAADPAASLIYNDFDIEFPGAKQDGAFNLVRNLKNAGVPIHAVGIQLHVRPELWVSGTRTAAQLRAAIQRFASLGVDVYLTELDLRLTGLSGSTALRLDIQGRIAHTIAVVCHQEPACKGVTTWGFTDRHSYLPPEAMPLPFDVNDAPKPFAAGLAMALRGEPPPAIYPPNPSVCDVQPNALFCDPLESETLAGLGRVRVAGGTLTSTTTAFRGERAARATSPTASSTRRAYLERFIPSTAAELWTRARVFVPTTAPNDFTLFALDEPSSPFYGVSAGLHTDGRLFLRVGGTTVRRAYGTAFPKGQWACLELQVRPGVSGGRADAYLNGAHVASITNAQTLFASGYGTAKAGIIWAPAGGPAVDVSVDEWIVSTTRPGCQ